MASSEVGFPSNHGFSTTNSTMRSHTGYTLFYIIMSYSHPSGL
jgi:hypothetical protein